MRCPQRSFARIVLTLAVATSGIAFALSNAAPVQAQCTPGEYSLQQSGVVGWVYVSSDRTVEWWAYIDGAYVWADSTSLGSNNWHADAEYIGSGPWVSYAAWKADVLGRAAALGQTIVFQQHAVVEETVVN